jgi:hypothetical protein
VNLSNRQSVEATQRLAARIVLESDIEKGVYQGKALTQAKRELAKLSK